MTQESGGNGDNVAMSNDRSKHSGDVQTSCVDMNSKEREFTTSFFHTLQHWSIFTDDLTMYNACTYPTFQNYNCIIGTILYHHKSEVS